MTVKLFFSVLFTCLTLFSCGQKRIVLGEQHAKQQVREALKNKTEKPFYENLIKDKETAISVVEPILFKVYGKDLIISERPYEVYLINGYWYITGTLPKKTEAGGTFEIIINSMNGQIITLTHYK